MTNWRRGFTIISVNKDFSGRQGYHMDTDCCREAVETLQAGQQAMSKPRHNLMQFHRHAKLKLERWQKNEYSPHFRRKKAKLPKNFGQNRVNCCCSIFDFFKEKNSSRAAFLFFVKKEVTAWTPRAVIVYHRDCANMGVIAFLMPTSSA